ncbi:MAG: type II restriction endonuclease, partial [Pseudopedobacter saltans]
MLLASDILRKYINSAYLKRKINRSYIDKFKQNITALFNLTDNRESEEYLKNLISDFLKNTYYSPDYYINTRGRSDLVIYNGKDPQSSVGVIIEAKALKNKAEMPSEKNLNTKAFQELLLYYLRERITQNNIDLKHLIITNLEEWYVFDAQLFEKLFAHDRTLIQQFNDFEGKRLAVSDHSLFYKEVAKPAIELNLKRISYCYFNILDYKNAIQNKQTKNDNQLIPLYKILSPEHLLKLPFNNDSNQLDKEFYSELLHIIGLKEEKDSGKSVIRRKVEKERNPGSLLECAIAKIDGMDILYNLQNRSNYGETKQEQLFNVGLELVITWINRILFLKLLEGQLIAYHKGDNGYTFLNSDKIRSFDDLNDLFFLVMAKQPSERTENVRNSFLNVPYLNSSLFELTELESRSINISALPDDIQLSLPNGTVLKDNNGKTKNGNIDTLEYLFAFLNAYDFTSDGAEDIQEENKNLINASVLGLIFEKINGYKDGSFFTPGFITMYIAEETIHKAILLKFKEKQGWDCKSLEELRENIKDRKAANELINSIKICDPAVGSGHFLVSALNEMIASKARLGILLDNNGYRINDYEIEVQNDELVIKDEAGKLFEYRPALKERQIVQETLFREKRTIIENCLFGVDVNPNSVKICQLRLWIELLKNAYYKDGGKSENLETLPNIDINIKCGNSLISRFPLDASLKHLLKGTKWTIETYQTAVSNYRNAHSKDEKHELLQLIKGIKEDFKKDIFVNDPIIKKIHSLRSNLLPLQQTSELFGDEKGKTKEGKKKITQLEKEIKKLEEKVEEIKNNKIYEQAFEWRFEFPEILDDDGSFIGFDCIIGNPPYIQLQKLGLESEKLAQMGFDTYTRMGDIYMLFFELGNRLLKSSGILTYITSNKWMRAGYGENLRGYLANNVNTEILIDFAGQKIFDAATVDTNILLFSKQKYAGNTLACQVKEKVLNNLSVFIRQNATICQFKQNESWVILSSIEQQIKDK